MPVNFAELTQIALLGTERQAISIAPSDSPTGKLEAQVDPARRERALLSLAVLRGLPERIGSEPARDAAPAQQPCPPEQKPCVGKRANTVPLRMFEPGMQELLPEWLRLAARMGVVASPETLPGLLDFGAGNRSRREAILAVLGERGRWLAGQNPAWSWAAGAAEVDESTWQTGNLAARCEFITQLRRSDPGRACELLRAAWKEESVEDRTALIQLFLSEPQPAEEPFLEFVLDDKSKGVRALAAQALSKLPGSALVQRMTERVRPLFTLDLPEPGSAGAPEAEAPAQVPGFGLIRRMADRVRPLLSLNGTSPELAAGEKTKRAKLVVTLPAECDKAMERDGIDRKPARGWGEKAWWLIQMLALTPLETWTQTWNTNPGEIVAASMIGDFKKEMLEAWSIAATRQRNADWAMALLPGALTDEKMDRVAELAITLPGPQREAWLGEVLDSHDPARMDHQIRLLAELDGEWSLEFSRKVLQWVQAVVARDLDLYRGRTLLHTLALRKAPTIAAEAARGWPVGSKNWDFWSGPVDEFLAVLQFRVDLHSAFMND